MVIDSLSNFKNYISLNQRFEKVAEYLLKTDLMNFPEGEQLIDGKEIYSFIIHPTTTDQIEPKIEVHRKYIDIQISVKGIFDLGWRSLYECKTVEKDYIEANDIQLFSDSYSIRTKIHEGTFVIFFPEDAHTLIPLDSLSTRVIIKVLV